MMPTFILTIKACNVTKIEAVDDKKKVIDDLEVSLEEMKIKPKQPLLRKEYNFTLKAYVNGGNFTITSNKTLRFGYELIKDGWSIYFLDENGQVQ